MDPLKRIVADRLRTQPAGAHPDAEVLSAFSENGLSANERQSVLEHLSSCHDCRDILFFSAPSAEETQTVLAPGKPRRQFALRWGTLAACIVIAAVVLVSRRQMPRTEETAALNAVKATNPGPAQTGTQIVASEQTPAELDSMREKEAAPRTRVAAPSRGYAAPKDIAAAPAAPMDFESYDDKIAAPQADREKDGKFGHPIANAPIAGRNAGELMKANPGAAAVPKNEVLQAQGVEGNANLAIPASSPAAQDKTGATIGGPLDSRQFNRGLSSANKYALHFGSVTGTVVDASGALINNAKVTAVGPQGQRSATSDASGKFSFNQLAAGTYLFNVDAPGFRKAVSEVAVLSEKPTKADFRLQVGSAAEAVSVQQAVVEAQPAVTGALVQNQARDETVLLSQVQAQAEQVAQNAELKKQKAANSRRAHPVAEAVAPGFQWTVSAQGAVQRSKDNGRTWVAIAVGENGGFRAVAFIANQVWVGGSGGTLYHSVDYGQHWRQVAPAVLGEKLQADIAQIQFSDPQHVVLITSNGQTWSSGDGGQTWLHQVTP